LRKKYGVNRLGLFGGFAKDLQTETSDIDLIVEIEKARKNLHGYMQLRRHLEKELGRKVDIGFENTIKPTIKSKILKELMSERNYRVEITGLKPKGSLKLFRPSWLHCGFA
jgi:hypothetical protein